MRQGIHSSMANFMSFQKTASKDAAEPMSVDSKA